MTGNCYRFLLVALFICVHTTVRAQSTGNTGPKDLYDWCPNFHSLCKTEPVVKASCPATCENRNPCREAGCSQECHLSANDTVATCSCADGYRLNDDGKSCSDIDECSENPSICENSAKPFCKNSIGRYSCVKCYGPDISTFYKRPNKCCIQNSTSECGRRPKSLRRHGDGLAKKHHWPWTGYVIVDGRYCGVSLIAADWVVTAAHCFGKLSHKQPNVTVFLGVSGTGDPKKGAQQKFNVREGIYHQNYSGSSYNIALLRLDKPANTKRREVGTVCLPNGETPREGDSCYALGYGALGLQDLRHARLGENELVILNSTACQERANFRFNPDMLMCAEKKKDLLLEKVDSGGPLVCQRAVSCDWYLAGVGTLERHSANRTYAFTKVEHLEEWISQQTGIPITKEVAKRRVWSEWGQWTRCTAACGGGTTLRSRSCIHGELNEPDCFGASVHHGVCNTQACVVASWSEYGEWSRCSHTCGGGTRSRARTCINETLSLTGCGGSTSERESCSDILCPPEWQEWTTWSDCSKSCESGLSTRNRTCLNGNVGDAGCKGNAKEGRTCNSNACPVWAHWSDWGPCNSSNGSDIQSSTRKCENGIVGQRGCEGSDIKYRSCPVWSAWGPFGACSVSCGAGTKSRTRTCSLGSSECVGNATEVEVCQATPRCAPPTPCSGKQDRILTRTCYVLGGFCQTYATYMNANCDLTCCERKHGYSTFCNDLLPLNMCIAQQSSCHTAETQDVCRKTCNLCTKLKVEGKSLELFNSLTTAPTK